jgi:hypothetical protein
MQLHGWKKYGLGAASMAVLVITILLVSGWGTAAADQLLNVFVTNTAANPVPVSGTLTINNPPASPVAVHETNTDGNGNIKVHEQGTVQVGGSVSVSNLPSTQPVSGTVNVGNFPAAPTTDIIASGAFTLNLAGAVLFGPADVSAYRELTLYMKVTTGGAGHCTFLTFPGAFPTGNDDIEVDSVAIGNNPDVIKTIDAVPPKIQLNCDLDGFTPVPIKWMLAGRTG